MMAAIQNTDFFILKDFREAATAMKPQLEGLDKQQKVDALQGFVGPFLIRLRDNGWPQRERILLLVEIWNEV